MLRLLPFTARKDGAIFRSAHFASASWPRVSSPSLRLDLHHVGAEQRELVGAVRARPGSG